MNVLLIGLRAVGKSTIGPLLAQRLQFAFVEHDDLVAAELHAPSAGQAIRDHGLDAFRRAESRVLGRVLETDRQVISLGGGTPTAPGAADLILEHRRSGNARVIHLLASLEVLKARLMTPGAPDRPALTGAADPAAEIEALAAQRHPFYQQLADLQVDVTDRTPAQVVQTVLEHPAFDLRT